MAWLSAFLSYMFVSIVVLAGKKHLAFNNYFPDFILILLFVYCFSGNRRQYNTDSHELYGLIHGLFAGLAADCSSLNIIGESMIVYGIIGMITAGIVRRVSFKEVFLQGILVFVLSIIVYLALGGVFIFIKGYFLLHLLAHSFVVSILNMIFFLILKFIFMKKRRSW